MLREVRQSIKALGNPQRAKFAQRYFKTGAGQYAEGDIFLGLSAPQIRSLAKQFAALSVSETTLLLKSSIHEERLLALLLLVQRFARASEPEQKKIFNLYLKHRRCVNNWDLVDCSADKIVGRYLQNRPKDVLYQLAKSKSLWDRRISVMATFHFIKQGEPAEALKIAAQLLQDKEDLIHKAVGWMLREIGKRNLQVEEDFLQKHYREMPRTMLRYAIERFPSDRRRQYLSGEA